jgi:cytochrome oxidase assembly protein ShyY1
MKILKRSKIILLIIILILISLSLYAAIWQWQRAQYHDTLLKNILTQQLDLNKIINLNTSSSLSKVGQTVNVKGRWLPNSTTYVSPRIINGIRGSLVISIFSYINQQGDTHYIAVHRGWAVQKNANLPPDIPPLPTTTIDLKGQWASKVSQSFELGSIYLNSLGLWQNYNITAHAQLTKTTLLPYILVLSTDSPDRYHAESIELKRESPQTIVSQLTEKAAKNRGYMVQWLGLFIVGCFGLILLYKQRLN